MKPLVTVEELTKSFGDRLLFADVTFGINEGDKIGLIAKNGTGKSTLLSILAGHEAPDSGTVTFRNDLKVGYLPQTPRFPEGSTALESCLAEKEPQADAWERHQEAERMLTQLGVSDLNANIATMSGGQQKRVAIAKMLLDKPDLLILDEPTNHLDIGVIEWLENYLRRQKVTLLLVTHDRYFLDRVCNKIIEMDHRTIFIVEGDYAMYLRRRSERIEALSGELAKVRNTLRKETEWMRRQPQARAGKAKYRIDQYYDLREKSRADYTERNVKLDVKSSYIGNKIFEAEGICKSFGDKLIVDNFNYIFARYERVGIVGPNGVGKSTFIKMLQGLVSPESGKWEIGETVKFGYYSQEGIAFDENKRVIDAVTEHCEDVVVNGNVHYSPMQFLQHFLFSPADQQKFISKLSGGERARLHLATVLMRSPNFLILDEPTNDLDIVTLGILEDYLAGFKGCLIVVSHDRFFLDSIVDHLFVFEGNGIIRDFPGNYTEYREFSERQKAQAATVCENSREQQSSYQRKRDYSNKLTFKERREFEELTKEIAELEVEIKELDTLFASGETISDITEKSARYLALKERLDEAELRWLELSEKE